MEVELEIVGEYYRELCRENPSWDNHTAALLLLAAELHRLNNFLDGDGDVPNLDSIANSMAGINAQMPG